MIVRGISTVRTMMVKKMMVMPKLLKKMLYSSTRLLTIGPMMAAFQTVPIRPHSSPTS